MKKLLLCVCLFFSLVSFLSAGGKVETRTVDNRVNIMYLLRLKIRLVISERPVPLIYILIPAPISLLCLLPTPSRI